MCDDEFNKFEVAFKLEFTYICLVCLDDFFAQEFVLGEMEVAAIDSILEDSNDVESLHDVDFLDEGVEEFKDDAPRGGIAGGVVEDGEVEAEIGCSHILHDLQNACFIFHHHIFQVVVAEDHLQ